MKDSIPSQCGVIYWGKHGLGRCYLLLLLFVAIIQNQDYCGQMMELLDEADDTTCLCSCAWWALTPVCTDPDSVWNLWT